MNFTKYKERVKDTCLVSLDNKPYFVLGLVGEIGEFYEEKDEQKKREELGDVCWYYAMICNAYKINPSLDRVSPINGSDCNLFIPASQIAEISKKEIRKGPEWFKKNEDKLFGRMYYLGKLIRYHALFREWNLNDIFQENINKLQERHG